MAEAEQPVLFQEPQEQVELVAVEMVALTQVLMAHLAQQTWVVALVVIGLAQVPQAMAVLVLSSLKPPIP